MKNVLIVGLLAFAGCGGSGSQSSLLIEKARAKVDLCEMELREEEKSLEEWDAMDARSSFPTVPELMEARELMEKVVEVKRQKYREAKRELSDLLK